MEVLGPKELLVTLDRSVRSGHKARQDKQVKRVQPETLVHKETLDLKEILETQVPWGLLVQLVPLDLLDKPARLVKMDRRELLVKRVKQDRLANRAYRET